MPRVRGPIRAYSRLVVRPASGASLLSLLVLAFCVLTGAAAAATVPARKAVQVDGRTVTLDQHADDPRFGLTPEQIQTTFGPAPSDAGPLAAAARAAAGTARRAPDVASASAPVTPDTTGCATQRTVDDRADERSTLPRYKAIYAYPRDQANRYATYKDLIQRSAGWVTDKVAESGGRGPRWDYGTTCGPGSLDILTVQLPRDASEYLASQSGRINLLTSDLDALRASWGLSPGTWNFVVWADWTGHSGWATGQGQHYLDDTPTSSNWNDKGGLYALLYGAGNVDFLGTGSLGYAAYAVTHEVGHTLGSVSDNAPHSTLAGHCTDGYSIMCYNDGGAQASLYSATACPSGGGPAGYDGVAFDCGGDDYLSASPAAGSWLSSHWNVFDSVFMCTAATCLGTADAAPPVAALTATPASAPTGTSVTLDASASRDPAGGALSYDLDAGDGRALQTGASAITGVTYARPGTYTARVVVHDTQGMTAEATTTVTVTNRPPSVALRLTPSPAVAGQPVTATATAADPEGTALSVAFDRDGDGTFETETGTALSTTLTAPAGSRDVGVRVTDADGASATAQATLTVSPGEPAPSADTVAGGPDPGADRSGPADAPAAAADPAPGLATVPGGTARPAGHTTSSAGRPAVVLARLHGGRVVVRVRCAGSGAAACRVRATVTAGPRRAVRTLTLRGGTSGQLTFAAGRSRSARVSVRDLASGRALPARTVLAR